MSRSYKAALSILQSRPARPRPSIASLIAREAVNQDQKFDLKWSPRLDGKPQWNGLAGIKEYLELLGYSNKELSQMKAIHVAGTKGKGSTCAFAYSFLNAHRERTGFPKKIGLYTSPHMLRTTERIRLNFNPLSEELFAKYFFEVWEKVSRAAQQYSHATPGYLQLLLLVSIHTFIQERVDAAIYETHSGGEYCSTNILQPVVTGITTLGLDHTDVLGPRIENVAWHKAGIFKTGTPAFSSPQIPAAAKVLQQRADEKEVHLKFTGIHPQLPTNAISIEPNVQKVNASLAIALTSEFLNVVAPQASNGLTSQDINRGIEQFSWPGRLQHIADGHNHWFLDTAHNELSLKTAASWFAKKALAMQNNNPSILIFSHASFRDGKALLECVMDSLESAGQQMQHIIFVPYGASLTNDLNKDEWLKILKHYSEIWKAADPNARVSLQPSISDALNSAKQIGEQENGMQTFITGSGFLVGPALEILEKKCTSLRESWLES